MASDGETDAALALARGIQQRAGVILQLAPKTNDLVTQWLGNTIGLMQKGLDLLVAALRQHAEHYRKAGPVTTFVHQPPCNGAAFSDAVQRRRNVGSRRIHIHKCLSQVTACSD